MGIVMAYFTEATKEHEQTTKEEICTHAGRAIAGLGVPPVHEIIGERRQSQ